MVRKYNELTEEQKEKRRQSVKNWRKENPEKARASWKRWASKNKEYLKERDKFENRGSRKDQQKQWRNKNIEKVFIYRQRSKDKKEEYKTHNIVSNTKEYKLWWSARKRATLKNIPFNLERHHIHIPEICPCCHNTINRPSIDRIVPAIGYIIGNIQIICYRCNHIKSIGSEEEHRIVADYIHKYSNLNS